jgi:hypothetical protein
MFVRGLLLAIYGVIAHEEGSVDNKALRDFFSIDADGSENKRKSGRSKMPDHQGDLAQQPQAHPPPPKPKILITQEINGGFRVAATTNASDTELVGKIITVKAAYDCIARDPFAIYNPVDFKFDRTTGDIHIALRGGRLISQKDNQLQILVEGVDFELRCNGFDANRDLKIVVTKSTQEA